MPTILLQAPAVRVRTVRRTLVAGLLAAGAIAALPASAAAGLAPTTCPKTSVVPGQPDRCVVVPVPLDRSGAVPGTVRLAVAVRPPLREGPATGTVLALAGGPGQAALPVMNAIASRLDSVLDHRQLVVFDQRGTGRSGELECPALSASSRETSERAAVAACADQIGPRRVAYTSEASVQDIEAVRAAVGVDRLILMGTSYGTKVAAAYAAAYPEHVERLILDSPLPPVNDPLDRATAQAMPALLTTLCARGACPFTRDAAGDLTALVQRLARRPVRGVAYRADGRAGRYLVNEAVVLGNFLGSDVDPLRRAYLPSAITSARRGDVTPLLMLGGLDPGTGTGGGDDDGVSEALFVATSCEDGPAVWPDGTPVDRRAGIVDGALAALPAGAFGPFRARVAGRILGSARRCETWPESPIAQPPFSPPPVPTLIVSGAEDLRTPPADAVALAAAIPGAQLVSVPDTGHSVLGSDVHDCAIAAIRRFVAGAAPAACKPARRFFPIGPLMPTRLAQLPRVPGLPARVGRTVNALKLTIPELWLRMVWGSPTRSGVVGAGLRGGTITANLSLEDAGFAADRFSAVPGVTVTGRYSGQKRWVFTVGGAAAAHGRLELDPRRRLLTGDLDGHPIRARVPPSMSDQLFSRGTASGRAAVRALRQGTATTP